jgi:hypothetical protein
MEPENLAVIDVEVDTLFGSHRLILLWVLV